MKKVNIIGTNNLLEVARISEVKKFFFNSTFEIYGKSKAIPTRQDDRKKPVTKYGKDKLKAENKLKSAVKEEDQKEFKLIEDEKRMENFILTIGDNIAFNSSHPHFYDTEFVRDLMNEYLKNEDYEKCSILKNHLNEISLTIV